LIKLKKYSSEVKARLHKISKKIEILFMEEVDKNEIKEIKKL